MSNYNQGELLKNIYLPEDIKKLPRDKLPQLCKEVREFIIEVLAENPGHLASGLGVIELTVALHYLYDAPNDSLIWDVGHQAYAHKVLTGRKDEFHTIRSLNGLSGFPKISESKYDSFGTGHSSTSISAALGMAIADKLQGGRSHHIAVIGDGSMTGGMAFEALNHAGATDENILIILNDNGISIDKKVGALGEYFTRITTSATYNRLKNKVWNIMGGNTTSYKKSKSFFRKSLSVIKLIFSGKSNFFEALNIRYFGPIDGNDLPTLLKTLEDIKKIKGPRILHIITKKGKGLASAECNPTTYHAPGVFNPRTGEIKSSNTKEDDLPLKFQDVFGETLVELAENNERIVGVTPAMLSGSSMNKLMDIFPKRTFDVGIAEQHAVTLSAGMAKQGIIPFCNIYSSFMQRAFDQVIHDVAIQKLPVVLCLDRAGLVGEDGSTHHGVFDLSYLRPIPNIIIGAPMNEIELRNMMFTAQKKCDSPFAIRYPRGKGFLRQWRNEMKEIEVGKGEILKEGKSIVILSLGAIGNTVIEAINELGKEGLNVGAYNMRFLRPLDNELIKKALENYNNIVTIEDGVITGGFGSAICEFASDNGYKNSIYRMGIPDEFINHGDIKELHKICKIDKNSIKDKILKIKELE